MTFLKFFSHPLMQLFSFCIILVGNANFSGPFGYFVFFATSQGYGYALTGMIGVFATIISVFLKNKSAINVQLTGLIFMCSSFIWFVAGNTSRSEMRDTLPFISLLLFVGVCSAVVTKAIEVHRRV